MPSGSALTPSPVVPSAAVLSASLSGPVLIVILVLFHTILAARSSVACSSKGVQATAVWL